ncbi:hypothetical protein ACHWQZ_G007160 [Mnemiopsis leidyi]
MSWSERALSYVKKLSTTINKNYYLPFMIDGNNCGIIHRENLQHFRKRPDLFNETDDAVQFSGFGSNECRSEAFNGFLLHLRDEGTLSVLKGWRNETYSVFKDGFRSEILFDIERAAVGIIGCE